MNLNGGKITTNQPSITIERIDHGVLPANDLGRAFRFWAGFMGAQLNFLTNMNARGLNREVPLIVFFTVANHAGFGIALQDFRLSTIRQDRWRAWCGLSR